MTLEEALKKSRSGRVIYDGSQVQMRIEVKEQNLVHIAIRGISEGTMTPQDAGELARQLGLSVHQGWDCAVYNNRTESKKRINLAIRKENTMPILLLGLLMSIAAMILAYYHLIWPVFGIIAAVVFAIDLIAAIVLALDSKKRL
jgi:hypothetical protein